MRNCIVGFFIIMLTASSAVGQMNVLTQHNDNRRTGANLQETVLNTQNVNKAQFGKLFTLPVDGQVYAQILYVSKVDFPGHGVHNVLYVATEHNSVYAFDADAPAQTGSLWHVNLGPSFPTVNTGCQNITVETGITGTPVIDLPSKTIYVVAKTQESGTYLHRLHALNIITGKEKYGGPTVIQGSVLGPQAEGSSGSFVHFNSFAQLQRTGLLLSKGLISVCFGAICDYYQYHGWLFTFDAHTLHQAAVYNPTALADAGGIWQSGAGPAADKAGHIYLMTGNGTCDAQNAISGHLNDYDYGDSFLKLLPSKRSVRVVDFFAPFNQDVLNEKDWDLGSSGPLLIPDTNLLVGGGKQGVLYVLNTANMGHFNPVADSQIVQSFQATPPQDPTTGRLHLIMGSPVYWNSPKGPMIYLWGHNDRLKAFHLNDAGQQFDVSPASIGAVESGYPGGALSVSANNSVAGTGIVWATSPIQLDATPAGVIRAYDASDLTNELWNSEQNSERDRVGLNAFVKFNPPTVANGKVYVPTISGQILVYGLLPSQ